MNDNIIDSMCKENIELLTKLGDVIQDRVELIRTERECSRLREQLAERDARLAAMTKRKDGWRRVAKAYRSNVFVTNSELREWSLLRRIERREARNGHTD